MISILNILNFLSIFLSVLFQIMLIRIFGATLQTDAYYLTIGIAQFVSMVIIGFATDMYIPLYNDFKTKKENESLQFTGAVFILIFIASSFFAITVYFVAPILVKVFATGFSPEKATFSTNLLKILSISVVFSSLNSLLIASLNANLFMLFTYAIALITPVLNNIALIFYARTYGLYALITAIVVGSILNFLILFLYHFKKIGWKFSNPYGNSFVKKLLKMNAPIRVADMINSLKGLLITNVLSYFPTGYMTLFSYTDKVLNILFRITNSPMLRLLFIKASSLLAMKKMDKIEIILMASLKSNLLLFICALVPTIILFERIFSILFFGKISQSEIEIMYSMLLCLTPFYLILTLELPFTNITIAMKKGIKILKVNIASGIFFIIFLLLGIKSLKIYVIPFAMVCAQLYNTFEYTKFVNNKLHFIDRDSVKMIIPYIALGFVILPLNYFLRYNFFIQLYSNILILVLWLIFVGRDFITVLRIITQKGEIK